MKIENILANKRTREFRFDREDGKSKVWHILQEGEKYYIVWGLLGHKLQITSDTPGDCGKEGTKAYKNPKEQCELIVERMIKKKLEEGYREFKNNKYLTEKIDDIIWGQPLPKNLCFYKPKNSIEDSKLEKINNSLLVATRKRDGMMHVIVKDDSYKGVSIYTRRMDEVTESFPHIVERLGNFELFPDKSILLGEMIYDDNASDNFKNVSRVCRSLPQEAIRLQKEELGWISYYVFDIAFWSGKNLLVNETYAKRLGIMYDTLIKLTFNDVVCKKKPTIFTVQDAGTFTFFDGERIEFDKLMNHVKEKKWEGLVLYIADKKMSQKDAFTFDGKARRPNCVFKKKPIFEDDFIVRFDPDNGVGKYGKGKLAGKFGAGKLYQLKNDKEVYVGDCGGGLTEEQRDRYADKELFPRVWRVEFSERTENGSIRFPVFNSDRTDSKDKEVEDCILA